MATEMLNPLDIILMVIGVTIALIVITFVIDKIRWLMLPKKRKDEIKRIEEKIRCELKEWAKLNGIVTKDPGDPI